MIEFEFEHSFRAPSIEAYWRCYFDQEHVQRLDEATGIRGRELVEEREEDGIHVDRIRITPAREVPGWLRKVTGASLEFEQRRRFDRAANRIDIEIVPAMFARRTRIESIYTLEQPEEGTVVRRYRGSIECRVPLVGGRVEKAVVSDMEKQFAVAVEVTQDCLDACAD